MLTMVLPVVIIVIIFSRLLSTKLIKNAALGNGFTASVLYFSDIERVQLRNNAQFSIIQHYFLLSVLVK